MQQEDSESARDVYDMETCKPSSRSGLQGLEQTCGICMLTPGRQGVADLSLHGCLQGDRVLQYVPEDGRDVGLMLGQEAGAWHLQNQPRASCCQHL